jgi:signal transduction histidine kinase
MLYSNKLPLLILASLFLPALIVDAQVRPAANPSLNVLTQAVQVLNLTPAEAERTHPIRLRGVVTCFDQRLQLCFVQDATAGVYVYNMNGSLQLKLADLVEVNGVSGAGLFSPIVHWSAINRIGEGTLPAPKPVSIEQLATGREDSQWVQVEGVIHRAIVEWGYVTLDLAAGTSRLKVRLLNYPKELENQLIDARVRVQGVAAASYNNKRQLTGFHMFVPSPAQVTTLAPGVADPFSAPIRLSRSLMAYSRDRAWEHRIRLRGMVTLQWPGEALFIKDESGGVQIRTQQQTPLAVGEVIDIAGFPALGGYTPILEDAIFRSVEKRAAPKAAMVSAAQAASGEFDNELVQIDAILVAKTGIRPTSLVLQKDKAVFHAYVQQKQFEMAASDLIEGSRLQITGVCSVEMGESDKPVGFSLWLRSPEDVVLLDRPAGWKIARAIWVFGGSGAVLLAGLVWMFMMRQRVRQQTKIITAWKQAEAALRQSEQQLRNSLEERERIGRDLHDSIIQSIYAVGLSLEDCKQFVNRDPSQVEQRLGKVLGDLNGVIREVRNFILGLESPALKGQEFKTALKSLVLTLGETHSDRFSLQIDPHAAESLNSKQATHLLHIAREAMSNSVRHARAERTVLSLQTHNGYLRFEVQDDGVGFDVNHVHEQGLGLRNMAARASELGAAFAVESRIGEGTRIMLDIPAKNPHQSA